MMLVRILKMQMVLRVRMEIAIKRWKLRLEDHETYYNKKELSQTPQNWIWFLEISEDSSLTQLYTDMGQDMPNNF